MNHREFIIILKIKYNNKIKLYNYNIYTLYNILKKYIIIYFRFISGLVALSYLFEWGFNER